MITNLENKCIINNETLFNHKESEEQDSYSSESIESPFNIPNNPIIQEERRTIIATSIIRTYYSNKIIEALNWLTENHELTINSLPYIQKLFENLHEYKELYYEDPFSSFISALYDGLSFENKWIDLNRDDFKKISKILTSLNNKKQLNYDSIDKSINELEKIGIDTTPY